MLVYHFGDGQFFCIELTLLSGQCWGRSHMPVSRGRTTQKSPPLRSLAGDLISISLGLARHCRCLFTYDTDQAYALECSGSATEEVSRGNAGHSLCQTSPSRSSRARPIRGYDSTHCNDRISLSY